MPCSNALHPYLGYNAGARCHPSTHSLIDSGLACCLAAPAVHHPKSTHHTTTRSTYVRPRAQSTPTHTASAAPPASRQLLSWTLERAGCLCCQRCLGAGRRPLLGRDEMMMEPPTSASATPAVPTTTADAATPAPAASTPASPQQPTPIHSSPSPSPAAPAAAAPAAAAAGAAAAGAGKGAAAAAAAEGGRASPPTEELIEDTLKCPICLDWFTDPVLLDCSHSLCLECARRLALHDGGTNTAEITCVLCKGVTSVGGGDEAKEAEDGLINDALRRFDIVPPRKSRPRIEVCARVEGESSERARGGGLVVRWAPIPRLFCLRACVLACLSTCPCPALPVRVLACLPDCLLACPLPCLRRLPCPACLLVRFLACLIASWIMPSPHPPPFPTTPRLLFLFLCLSCLPPQDLRTCYDNYLKNGLAALEPGEAKPTALHMRRAVVARLESQTQEALGERPSTASSAATGGGAAEDAGEEGEAGAGAGAEAGSGEGPEDPMKKLRFKKNVLLNNLVQHFKEQQLQRAASAASLAVSAEPSQSQQSQPTGEEYDPELYAFDPGSQEEGELRSPTTAVAPAPAPAPASGATPGPAPATAPATAPAPAPAPSRRSGGNPVSRHVWVGNLRNGTTEQHLRQFFGQCGPVENARIVGRAADPSSTASSTSRAPRTRCRPRSASTASRSRCRGWRPRRCASSTRSAGRTARPTSSACTTSTPTVRGGLAAWMGGRGGMRLTWWTD